MHDAISATHSLCESKLKDVRKEHAEAMQALKNDHELQLSSLRATMTSSDGRFELQACSCVYVCHVCHGGSVCCVFYGSWLPQKEHIASLKHQLHDASALRHAVVKERDELELRVEELRAELDRQSVCAASIPHLSSFFSYLASVLFAVTAHVASPGGDARR